MTIMSCRFPTRPRWPGEICWSTRAVDSRTTKPRWWKDRPPLPGSAKHRWSSISVVPRSPGLITPYIPSRAWMPIWGPRISILTGRPKASYSICITRYRPTTTGLWVNLRTRITCGTKPPISDITSSIRVRSFLPYYSRSWLESCPSAEYPFKG